MLYTFFLILTTFSIVYFLHSYYIHYPREFSSEWQYGYKDAIAYVGQVQDRYDRVVMTTQLGRPYIYYLFYLRIPPSVFRSVSDVSRDSYGFVTVKRVGKYTFSDNTNSLPDLGKTLFIVSAGEQIPANALNVKTFYFP